MKYTTGPMMRSRERGAILLVALLFLVILTMLGVTAMTGPTMEERMAGNARDSSIALQAAEAALRDGRRDISGLPVTGTGTRNPALDPLTMFGSADKTPGSCNSNTNEKGLCIPENNPDTSHYKQASPSILP